MQTFYSNGKLLITAEYVVLDGAKALAIPTSFGQTLTVEVIDGSKIIWKSIDEQDNVWFEDEFIISKNKITSSHDNQNEISKRLIDILNAAKTLNPDFLNSDKGFAVTSKLEFPRNWGLGSSSTLLNNIAQWTNIEAFALSNATFGGSGYDIACASNNTPILYTLTNRTPNIEIVDFNPHFKDQLFFIHLNQKQDSRDAIKTYREHKQNSSETIREINDITNLLVTTDSFSEFEKLILKHETLIGKITNQTTVKERLFNDYKNTVKSLGGWGGDFILATGKKDYVKTYFKSKGFETILPYSKMVL